MASEDLNLTGVKSLDQALARTKNGSAAVELAKRIGLWTADAHASTRTRVPFPATLSDLTPSQLSDLNAAWTAEYGRIIEVCGAINGQSALLKLQLKRAQAGARARVLRGQAADAKPLSQGALADLAEADPSVADLHEQTGLLAVLESHAHAAKDATERYLNTISREIAFRDAQMKARLY